MLNRYLKIKVCVLYFREEKTEALAETKEELEQTNLIVVKLKEEVNLYILNISKLIIIYCI